MFGVSIQQLCLICCLVDLAYFYQNTINIRLGRVCTCSGYGLWFTEFCPIGLSSWIDRSIEITWHSSRVNIGPTVKWMDEIWFRKLLVLFSLLLLYIRLYIRVPFYSLITFFSLMSTTDIIPINTFMISRHIYFARSYQVPTLYFSDNNKFLFKISRFASRL